MRTHVDDMLYCKRDDLMCSSVLLDSTIHRDTILEKALAQSVIQEKSGLVFLTEQQLPPPEKLCSNQEAYTIRNLEQITTPVALRSQPGQPSLLHFFLAKITTLFSLPKSNDGFSKLILGLLQVLPLPTLWRSIRTYPVPLSCTALATTNLLQNHSRGNSKNITCSVTVSIMRKAPTTIHSHWGGGG